MQSFLPDHGLQRLSASGMAGRVALALAAVFSLAIASGPAQATGAGVPPFCIKRGGSMGPDSRAQICRWYDYQTCLQAAADLNGNCVVNIDYKGIVSLAPAAPRDRRAR
jgi:hypothetical protein